VHVGLPKTGTDLSYCFTENILQVTTASPFAGQQIYRTTQAGPRKDVKSPKRQRASRLICKKNG
ncbi:MAG: hypothetical protein VX694_06575, partial [Planctomycetota bacterium]|nr:hypothetical protein [Planctomycetota bacterium]